jgi:NADH-quinone oxidoreductase E subunit
MFVFSPAAENKIRDIIGKYPVKRSAILPLLELAQRQEGYVTAAAMEEIGRRLDLSPAYVQSVCSFYSMFHTEPVGKYVIRFCVNISCHLSGCDELLDYAAQKLKIKIGSTTPDKRFTLLKEECLAECCAGPVMRINDTYHTQLTRQKIDQVLDSLK